MKQLIDSAGNNIEIVTDRLILRPWSEADAFKLYEYASDFETAFNAGWVRHKSPEFSKAVIKTVYSRSGAFAMDLRDGSDTAIGSVTLYVGESKARNRKDNEGDIGYWVGKPFRNRGYVTEAVLSLIDFAFNELKLNRVWCSYYEGNFPSLRVMEKCGFIFDHIVYDSFNPMLQNRFTEIFYSIKRSAYLKE